MIVMVWMSTGFAMVVFSAAIKAIPTEFIEAGQIDGAGEGKIFLSIVLPYIKSTIIVVSTYITVSVLKAFDIVGIDLTHCLIAVCCLGESASSWAKQKSYHTRSGIDFLRLALEVYVW